MSVAQARSWLARLSDKPGIVVIKGVPLIDDDGQKLSNVGFDLSLIHIFIYATFILLFGNKNIPAGDYHVRCGNGTVNGIRFVNFAFVMLFDNRVGG